MQMPAAHKAPPPPPPPLSAFLSLSRSCPRSLSPDTTSARTTPSRVEVFEFFLFTPTRGTPFARAPPFSTVLPFIGTPECLHCETSGDRPPPPYVGFMNFICSDKTTRIYSRRIFIYRRKGVFLSRLPFSEPSRSRGIRER